MPRTRARVLLATLVGLALLALALGGRVWAHYRSTPGFRAWARATPVDEAVWRAAVPAGRELGRGERWRSDAGPARARFGQWRSRATFAHGTETLLDLEVEVRVESRAVALAQERALASEAFAGLEAFVTVRAQDRDFHGVAVLTLVDLARYGDPAAEPAPPQGPRMQLDVFALAGPGPVQLVVQEVAGDAPGSSAPLLAGREFPPPGAWPGAEALARFLSLEVPPAEGIAYQTRCVVTPTWSERAGGASSAERGARRFAATTAMYSAELRAIHALRSPFDAPDRFGFSSTDSARRSYRWNGATW